MSNIPITSLPITNPLTGEETVPIVQSGTTKRTTTGAIASLPLGQGTAASGVSFVTVGSSFAALPNSRVLAAASPIALTDGGASGAITIGFTPTLNGPLTINGGPLTINSTASSLTQGFSIVQSAVGSTTTYTSLNRLLIAGDTVAATTASGVVVGLDIAHLFGGNDQGARSAMQIEARRIAASNAANVLYQDVGLGISFNSAVNNNGTGILAKGQGFAGYTSAQLATGATFWEVLNSFQFGLGIETGASSLYAIGVRIGHNPNHAVKGSAYDTALDFVDDATATGGWDALITSSNVGGNYPIAATGTFIRTLGAQTFATGIDMSSATLIDFLRGPSDNFRVTGTGAVNASGLTTPTVIGGTATGSSLTLQSTSGAGTTDFVNCKVGNNGAVEAWRTLTNGVFLFGYTNSVASVGGNIPTVQQHATAAIPYGLFRWNSGAGGPTIGLHHSRSGTIGTNSILSDGDVLGNISFLGADGSAFIQGAAIAALVDGTPSAAIMPGSITLSTTPRGAGALTERLRIDNAGKITQANGSSIPAGGTATVGYSFTSATNFGVYCGSGAPSMSAAQGSLYLRSDGTGTATRMYVNTNGATSWTAVSTVT
mgnify:CR=1 FL=1